MNDRAEASGLSPRRAIQNTIPLHFCAELMHHVPVFEANERARDESARFDALRRTA
jgi:hypothetical protein